MEPQQCFPSRRNVYSVKCRRLEGPQCFMAKGGTASRGAVFHSRPDAAAVLTKLGSTSKKQETIQPYVSKTCLGVTRPSYFDASRAVRNGVRQGYI